MSWRGPALMVLCVAALYVLIRPWLVDLLGPVAYVVIVIVIGALVGVGVAWWQSHRQRYLCPQCGHSFSVSLVRHLVGQNWFGRLRTRCPSCTRTEWCDPVADAS